MIILLRGVLVKKSVDLNKVADICSTQHVYKWRPYDSGKKNQSDFHVILINCAIARKLCKCS